MVQEDYISRLRQKYPTFATLRDHIGNILQSREQITVDPVRLGKNYPVAGVLLSLVLPLEVIERNLDPIPYLHIIYEKRSEELKNHPGQMAFPGGTMEEVDSEPKDTAFREAMEEVGINPSDLDFVAYMDEFVAISKIMVYPVIAWLIEDEPISGFQNIISKKYAPKTEESTHTIVMPLTHLLNPDYYRHRPYTMNGEHVGWVRYFDTTEIKPGDNIWGLTASMTRRFIDEVFTDNQLPLEDLPTQSQL